MRELKSHRSVYDIEKTSAWSGPYRRPGHGIAEVADWIILVLFFAFLTAIYFGVM